MHSWLKDGHLSDFPMPPLSDRWPARLIIKFKCWHRKFLHLFNRSSRCQSQLTNLVSSPTSSTFDDRNPGGPNLFRAFLGSFTASPSYPYTSYNGASYNFLDGAVCAFRSGALAESCFDCSSAATTSTRATSTSSKFEEEVDSLKLP